MKTALLSFVTSGIYGISDTNRNTLSEILDQNISTDLMVCAGWTLKSLSDIKYIQNHSGNSHTTWVAEVGAGLSSNDKTSGFYVVRGKTLVKKAIKQIFAKSADTDPRLIQDYIGTLAGERLFSAGNSKVRLVICGENNFLTNKKENGFKAELRFKNPKLGKIFDEILEDTDIFINSAHTPMGNMNKMRKRWELLSKNNRTCVFVTNECVVETTKGKASNSGANLDKKSLQYFFKNGKEQPMEYEINQEKGYRICSIVTKGMK